MQSGGGCDTLRIGKEYLSKALMHFSRREVTYVLLMGLAVGFAFVRSIVFGARLGPEQMGYYSVATSIAAYGMFLQFGLMSGLNRELPIRLGARDYQIIANLVGETTVSVVSAQGAGFVVYLLVISLVRFENPSMRTAFALGGLLALSTPLIQMVYLRLRASQMIIGFSVLQATTALLIVLVGYFSIPPLGYRGPILTIALINIVGFGIVTARFLEPVNYRYFKRSDVVYLIRIGAPLMAAGVVTTLVMGMDRLFMIKYGTPTELGIYQIASMPITFGILLSAIISQYMGPKLLYGFGGDGDLRAVYRKAVGYSFGVAALMLSMSPFVTPVARFVFERWLPEYVEGLPIVRVLYVGAIMIPANVAGIVISAANRQLSLLVGSVAVTLCGLVYYLGISRAALPMIWYAYGNAALQCLNYIVVLGLAYRSVRLGNPRLEHSF
jgi:O-antigen/teichoic acid export membrane protein